MENCSKLRGHRRTVNSLQVGADGTTLVSASDDKTVRLWDIESGKTTKCLTACFKSDIEAVTFGLAKDVVYVGCTDSISTFDLRREGLILKEPLAQVGMEGGDEVSNMALNSKGDLLAVAMDSGVINLIPVRPNGTFCENSGATRYRRLVRQHTNIVNTVTFKPTNPKELLSGGFDYNACIWETDRGKPKATTSFTALPALDSDPADMDAASDRMPMQMVNPPFVMAIKYVLGGRCVVAALGDGTVRVLNAKDLSYITAVEAHHCMITALYADDCHVVTGGTDCMIHAFKLIVPAEEISAAAKSGSGKGAQKKKQSASVAAKLEVQIVPLFSVAHDRKVNALACVFAPYVSPVEAGKVQPAEPVSAEARPTVATTATEAVAAAPAPSTPAPSVAEVPAAGPAAEPAVEHTATMAEDPTKQKAADAVQALKVSEPSVTVRSSEPELPAAPATASAPAAVKGGTDIPAAAMVPEPRVTPAEESTGPAESTHKQCRCRCFVADTSGDITQYMYTF